MRIRGYEDKDLANCEQVCLATATCSQTDKNRAILSNMYLHYYVMEEPSHCFVLADDEDKAVGYLICATDFATYKRVYREKYLPALRKLSFGKYLMKVGEGLIGNPHADEYPAHLHIDLLPVAQRGGWGTRMMDTLLAKLAEEGVRGVHLGCYSGNEKGNNFYRKYGFSLLSSRFGCNYYGIKLPVEKK